jgi:hypothetical protein
VKGKKKLTGEFSQFSAHARRAAKQSPYAEKCDELAPLHAVAKLDS